MKTTVNVRAARRASPEFQACRNRMEGYGYEFVALAPLVTNDRHPRPAPSGSWRTFEGQTGRVVLAG